MPVLLADVKGDLSGLAQPGQPSDKITARAADTGDDWQPTAYPVEFYSLGGGSAAVPIRATMTQFGPILLAKVLDLNSTQEATRTDLPLGRRPRVRLREAHSQDRRGARSPAEAPGPQPPQRHEPGFFEKAFESPAVRSFLRSAGNTLGCEITRGMVGTRRR